MIRRETADGWLLISQIDHAVLAAEVAAAWGNDDVPTLPLRDELLRAIRLHDDGWYDWEQVPTIVPETGKPRDFTEMPMAEAATIWTESVELAARGPVSTAAAAARLGDAASVTDVAVVLDAALGFPSRFSLDELRTAVDDGVGEPGLDQVRNLLVESGVLRSREPRPMATDRVYEVADQRLAENPFGGMWVSRHFARLAEHAKENRDDPLDIAAASTFLDDQETRREDWWPALETFAGDDAEAVANGGYRLLRFFDWVSLWLCCRERDEGTDMELPGGPTIRFEPDGPGRFRLAPWPLAVERLELAVPAVAIPPKPLASDEELAAALDSGASTEVTFDLRPAGNGV